LSQILWLKSGQLRQSSSARWRFAKIALPFQVHEKQMTVDLALYPQMPS
jgi:hypothetical protein